MSAHLARVPAVVCLTLFFATGVGAQSSGTIPPPDRLTDAESTEWDATRLMEHVELLTAADLPQLQARAESGDARSQVLLGLAHEFGSAGLRARPQEGLAWFLRAAAQGIPWAEAWAADFYLHGASGVERDLPRALALYSSAANRGDPRAAFMLGQMYFFGEGVTTDMAAADRWFGHAERDDTPLATRMKDIAAVTCATEFCAGLQVVLGAMASTSTGRLTGAWDEKTREWQAAVALPGLDYCGVTASDRTEAGQPRDFFCDSERIDDAAAGLARAREIAARVEDALPAGYTRTDRLDGRPGPAFLFTRDGYPKVRVAFNTTPGSAQHRVTLLVGP